MTRSNPLVVGKVKLGDRNRAIVERLAAGASTRAVGAEFGLTPTPSPWAVKRSRAGATVDVIKLERVRDRPPRFAHLWKTADVGSVFRFSGALDGFGNPLASARHWCRKYRPDLGV